MGCSCTIPKVASVKHYLVFGQSSFVLKGFLSSGGPNHVGLNFLLVVLLSVLPLGERARNMQIQVNTHC